jgi:putative transposase
LAEPQVHDALLASWREADHWSVGLYVVMPEHVHLFCTPTRWDRAPVRQWCRYWKGLVGKREPRLKGVFLGDCWDTQMRSQEHYLETLEYTRLNPVRRGLTAAPERWPYMGDLHPIDWIL